MKKTVICLVLIGAFAFAVKFTFAQDTKSIIENDSFAINQDAGNNSDASSTPNTQGPSDTNAMLTNMQGNVDVTLMPFVPQDNSDNAVSGQGN
jgi:hypothetical protein